MKNSEKILKILSGLVENGILSTQDAKNEILNKSVSSFALLVFPLNLRH